MVDIKKLAICSGVGIFLGIIGFTISIASMGGVFFRGDRFILKGYLQFYRAPFLTGTSAWGAVWGILPDGTSLPFNSRINSLSMNWVVFAGAGAILGSLAYIIINI